jgi:voltage-gated potassium channel
MTTPTPPRHRPRDTLRATMESRLRVAITSRRAFQYLTLATAVLAALVGVLMTVVDHRDFPTVGDGLWWAVQTLSTVGYGDIVPTTGWGRLLGSVVIVLGVTFLAFLTASVTSTFIAAEQDRRAEEGRRDDGAGDDALEAALGRIEERLAVIEARLTERGDA